MLGLKVLRLVYTPEFVLDQCSARQFILHKLLIDFLLNGMSCLFLVGLFQSFLSFEHTPNQPSDLFIDLGLSLGDVLG